MSLCDSYVCGHCPADKRCHPRMTAWKLFKERITRIFGKPKPQKEVAK